MTSTDARVKFEVVYRDNFNDKQIWWPADPDGGRAEVMLGRAKAAGAKDAHISVVD